MDLSSLTRPEAVFPDVAGDSCKAVLSFLVRGLAERKLIKNEDKLLEKLLERETLCSTGLGRGLAVPHCKLPRQKSSLLAIGLHRRGIAYEAPDELPVRAFFLLISPKSAPIDHLQALAEISRWVQVDGNLDDLLLATEPAEILAVVARKAKSAGAG